MPKQKSLAKTNPRFTYRTPQEDKANIEGRIKELVEKANSQECEHYHINQNTIFLEIIYRGLDYLERIDINPSHDEGYYQIEFKEKKK